VLVPVDDDLEARIAELIEARRDEVAQLVRSRIDTLAAELVEAEFRSRNGNGHARKSETSVDLEVLRACSGACGRTLPASAFERGRSKCRQCRRAEQRDRELRARPADPEPPRTATDA
jgi:hypothetical protein